MSFRLGNITSSDVKDQVVLAMVAYREISNGAVEFDFNGALDLSLTPERNTAARSESLVNLGGTATKVYFIAFEPGNGTGDESAFGLGGIASMAGYPHAVQVVPRYKSNFSGEVHLTVTTFNERGLARPFAGCLDLVGFGQSKTDLAKLGTLGQTPRLFEAIVSGQEIADPTATFTLVRSNGGDFGGEHAVYNATGLLQVCAFIGIPRDIDPGVLHELQPQLPRDSRR